MSEPSPPKPERRPSRGWRPWQIALLILSVLLTAAGVLMLATASASEPGTVGQILVSPPHGTGSSFIAGGVTPSDEVGEPAGEASWQAVAGRWLVVLAAPAAVGMVAGIFFRTFVAAAAVLTAVLVVVVVGLSYFEVIHVDLTTMQTNYESTRAWAGGQAGRAVALLAEHWPSALTFGLGFVGGFLRR